MPVGEDTRGVDTLEVVAVLLPFLYGLFFCVALGNALLMLRPGVKKEGPAIRFLIPARDEEENLRVLLPLLAAQGKITVFDDDSSDATAAVARDLGAEVIRAEAPLPPGWTGKNRANHLLGFSDYEEEYICFLDADVRVSPDFASRLRSMAQPNRVATAFPAIRHGDFPEPIMLGWVGWSLLALNPFFLVRLTGKGHNRFTNGQITLWPAELYRKLRANEQVRNHILEDVLIGRLLGKNNVPVDVAILSADLSVQMYKTWRKAFDGMSKNSFEIAGSSLGTFLLAFFLLVLAWGWLILPWWGAALLFGSSVCTSAVVRGNILYSLALSLTVGAVTLVRSWWWHRTGQTVWKGRKYTP